MTLLVNSYHRAQAGPQGNAPAMLDAHFSYLAAHCNCVVPGEQLPSGQLNVCLTFDDAYFDFYSVVFPLLQKHNLRAVLSVPSGLIREHAAFPDVTRTNVRGDADHPEQYGDGFCTWPELSTLAASGRVVMAAQGHTHCPLDRKDIDCEAEILQPRALLSSRLDQPIDSFVFPQGRFSARVLRQVRQHYRYAFGIGPASHQDWDRPLIYRSNGDEIAAPQALLSQTQPATGRTRSFLNRVSGGLCWRQPTAELRN